MSKRNFAILVSGLVVLLIGYAFFHDGQRLIGLTLMLLAACGIVFGPLL